MSDLLQFVKFKDLVNWSVPHLLKVQFNYNKKYMLFKISDFLTRNKTQIIIDDEVEYKRVKIKQYNQGLFLRNIEIGKKIGTKKQYKIKERQFLLSKIDARNGAFGVVGKEIDKAIITGNFWTYDVDYKKINPFFLSLITTTKQFMQFCDMASSGTTNRHYLQENRFLGVEIPLPPLKTQREIVKNYKDKLDLAKEQNQLAKQKETEIETYLYNELGIELPKEEKPENNNILKLVRFKDLDVWSFEQLKFNSIFNSIFKISELGTICKFKNKKFDKNKYGNEFFNYVDIGSVDPFKNILEAKKMKVKNAPHRATQHINSEDLIITTTRPYLKKFAIVSKEFNNYVCSSGFSVISYAENIYNLHFIKAFLQSYYGIEQLKEKMTGGLYPAITKLSLKTIKIPLPPLKIQTKIANHIQVIKDEIKSLKQRAEQNQKDALNEFEQEVFNEA